MTRPWELQQRFVWRASTVLLAFMWMVPFADILRPQLAVWQLNGLVRVCESLGPIAELAWVPAAVLALAFLIASFVLRNPQLQYLFELGLALAIGFTPAY